MPALPLQQRRTFASVEAFRAYDFGDDLTRELIDGVAVAQAAPSSEHGRIVANLARAIGNALEWAGSRCHVEVGTGVVPRRRQRPTYRVPDLAILCPGAREDGGEEPQPVIVIEALSPSNSAGDMDEKATDYKSIAAIRQVVHLKQDRAFCAFQRKAGDLWIVEEREGRDAVLPLEAIGIEVPLALVYQNIAVQEYEAEASDA